MNKNVTSFEHAILIPLAERSISFLKNDLEIEVLSESIDVQIQQNLKIKKNTAMIGTGGSVQVLVTMGYDDTLLEKIVEAFVEGETIADEELEEIRESVSCEVVNTIVGNALQNPKDGTTLGITPPILISDAKSVFKQKSSQILSVTLKTEFGEMLISVIGQKETVSKKLNFKEI